MNGRHAGEGTEGLVDDPQGSGWPADGGGVASSDGEDWEARVLECRVQGEMLRCRAPERRKVRAGCGHKGRKGVKSRTWCLSPWKPMSSQRAVGVGGGCGGGSRGSSGQKPSFRIALIETPAFKGLRESRVAGSRDRAERPGRKPREEFLRGEWPPCPVEAESTET